MLHTTPLLPNENQRGKIQPPMEPGLVRYWPQTLRKGQIYFSQNAGDCRRQKGERPSVECGFVAPPFSSNQQVFWRFSGKPPRSLSSVLVETRVS